MFSSETVSRDVNGHSFLFYNTSSKHDGDGEFLKNRENVGSSEFFQTHQQQSSGLARYRSAPSSFFATFLDSVNDNNSSGDESDSFFPTLLNGSGRDLNHKTNLHHSEGTFPKPEHDVATERGTRQNGFSDGSYGAPVNNGGGSIVGSYSIGMEKHVQVPVHDGSNGNGNWSSSNLIRQSSSPAGLFSDFGIGGEVGNYSINNHAERTSAMSSLNNHMNFSSGASSSSRFMPVIPENGNESIGPFNNLKRNRDGDLKTFSNFNGLDNQMVESRKTTTLTHHLSLPKTSSEMAAVEKILHFQQDVVPCQVRAKRGCATHPRSIAERMRRTRISERMKKLQDLFPNMDKQTNTAEMLDLAVEYIKDLQKQVQTLNDAKAKCICSSNQKEVNPTTR